jgi:uncharacterized protein YecE (DUF72 family)
MGRGTLFVGTSGFAFKEWKGVFYPEDVSDKEMLAYYAKVLPSVEINYTFRRMPSEATLAQWKSRTESGFRFALKAPQRITHLKRLKEVTEDVDEFLRRIRLLEERLGTVLFQLPPNAKYERERLEKFLAGLPPVFRYAMEFRNESWKNPEVSQLLSKHEVALCGADTEATPLEQVPLTAEHAYLRLRREEYGEDQVLQWAARVGEVLADGRDVYCYFKHEGGGLGPRYAHALREAVG